MKNKIINVMYPKTSTTPPLPPPSPHFPGSSLAFELLKSGLFKFPFPRPNVVFKCPTRPYGQIWQIRLAPDVNVKRAISIFLFGQSWTHMKNIHN